MKQKLPLLVLLIYLVVQLISLPKVGMTWDEPSSFFFGRTALHFYLTGDRGYVTDSEYTNSKRFGKDPFQYIYGEDVYPPFPFIIASGTSYIFSEHLHLVDPITAHHAGLVLLGGLGVFAMYGIGLALGWGTWIALGIALLYGTYPTIIAQMRNDAKDVPLMSMLVVFVFFTLKWLYSRQQGGWRHILYGVGTGISLGLAIASKPTAAIIVPIIGVWFIFSYLLFPSFRKQMGHLGSFFASFLLIGPISVAMFFLAWPWLWDNPIQKIMQVWQFFKVVGRGMPTLYLGTVYHAGVDLPWHYPLVILGTQTPPTVLLVGLISLFSPLWIVIRKRNPLPLLFLFWIVIGMGRFFVPGVLIYAKVRHFIDVMPAFFILIGVFVHELSTIPGSIPERFQKYDIKKVGHVVTAIVLIIMIGHQLLVSITHFPYEPSYFNVFIGGTKTVAEKRLFDIEYWASAVKDGMNYIDSVSTKDKPAKVYACSMAHLALFYETPAVRVTSNPIGASYAIVPNSASWFGGVMSFMKDNHELAYTVKRNGGDLLWVYKMKSFSGWNCGQETGMVYVRP